MTANGWSGKRSKTIIKHVTDTTWNRPQFYTVTRWENGKLTLDQTLPVSERAWRMQGSKMFVKIGSQVRVEDLIRGVIIQSGNDACVVKKTPRRLISIIRLSSSTVVSAKSFGIAVPALFTRMSSLPRVETVVSTAVRAAIGSAASA